MFNWKKKLLSSLDIKKQEKALDKNKTVEVAKLISKRLFDINNNTGSYVGGKVSIDDRPFTAEDRDNYSKKRAKQIKNREQVEFQLPSTAISKARFDEGGGKIFVTFVGGNKEYVFKGDRKTWLNFMNSGSKGQWVNYVLKKYNRAPRSWWN